jgi:hypothetical protein
MAHSNQVRNGLRFGAKGQLGRGLVTWALVGFGLFGSLHLTACGRMREPNEAASEPAPSPQVASPEDASAKAASPQAGSLQEQAESKAAAPGYSVESGGPAPAQPPRAESARGRAQATEPPAELYASIADAEAALARAERELNQALVASTASGGASPKRKAPSSPAAGAAPPSPAKPGAAADEEASGDSVANRCAVACRAFGSLRRAADAVCRLAGEADARCKRAQGVVNQSRSRVSACSCSE